MKKIFSWMSENILFFYVLFLLAFIPLYPKLPLLGVEHTWVYVRLDDIAVALGVAFWFLQFLRRKVSFKTPLIIPILLFWAAGTISTISAIIFIFPYLANVFPNVALLHILRRIEYISLFFVAFSSIRSKNFVLPAVIVSSLTLLSVVAYGAGQRLYGFPAFLTMNEEFAKGIPLRLSALARIPSTFAGHYDLAAYLVMLIVLMGSMIFGIKNVFAKLYFLGCAVAGLILLLMTASRVSFSVYLCTVIFMLILQKKKIFIIPVIIASIMLLSSFQGISQRFGSTISQVDLVVDARTGKAIGVATNQVSSGTTESKKKIVIEDTQSTGENLPQGTGYITLPAAPTEKTITQVVYKRSRIKAGSQSAEITNLEGDFVVKKVLAYDLSFTTRFQGEWPRALQAFKRNMLLGSGYSSISLASDNNYLRILGEAGLLGFASFLLIFIIFGIYVAKVLPDVNSPVARSFIIGSVAGILGLALNAVLIDVFEASKVAYVLWMLIGISTGVLYIYQKRKVDYIAQLKKILLSHWAIIAYLVVVVCVIFSVIVSNYFVGDDFTWLRWAADCTKTLYSSGETKCVPTQTTIIQYFTNAGGFFYRPGTKTYFFFMHALFGLNPFAFHVGSILFHALAVIMAFLFAAKILKSKLFGFIAALLFLVASINSEIIFWIAASGHLIASGAILTSLVCYLYYKEGKHWVFLPLSFLFIVISALFYEIAIIVPFAIIAVDLLTEEKLSIKHLVKKWVYPLYILLIPLYLLPRYLAKSHWFNGDYSYRVSNLLFNIFGNMIGYIGLILLGTRFLPYYHQLRSFGKHEIVIVGVSMVVAIALITVLFSLAVRKLSKSDTKVMFLTLTLFVIFLLPFLGFGNVALRYAYLASFALLLFVTFWLQKIYLRVARMHRILAIFLVFFMVLLFGLFHIRELYRANDDWRKAGEISQKLLISMNDTFQVTGQTPHDPVFYFVNPPIRQGEAWVFPVGLPDALWFTFQNENLTVHVTTSLELALDQAEGSTSARVFDFDKNGGVEEVIRTKNIITVPIIK